MFSDASLTGWGAYCNNERANGYWTIDDKNKHINFLELKAAYFGLQCFAKTLKDCNILLRIDNTTAIAYLNKMGGAQHTHLNDITRKIWQWCERRNIVIFASYIASKENVEADEESRRLEPETEFSLSDYAFKEVIQNFGIPDIDLFASHSNKKCERFISWKKDPESETVDAFTINWKGLFFYAFPPFSIVLKVLRKIKVDTAEGIVIVPDWPGQPWFPLFKKMLVKEPIRFKPNKNLIMFSNRHHPMWRSITLWAGLNAAHAQPTAAVLQLSGATVRIRNLKGSLIPNGDDCEADYETAAEKCESLKTSITALTMESDASVETMEKKAAENIKQMQLSKKAALVKASFNQKSSLQSVSSNGSNSMTAKPLEPSEENGDEQTSFNQLKKGFSISKLPGSYEVAGMSSYDTASLPPAEDLHNSNPVLDASNESSDDDDLDKEFANECHVHGLHVKNITFDGASSNISMVEKLGASIYDNTSISFFESTISVSISIFITSLEIVPTSRFNVVTECLRDAGATPGVNSTQTCKRSATDMLDPLKDKVYVFKNHVRRTICFSAVYLTPRLN
ncbi:unnamed protein product [Trichogramma brassicae]|uniref:RNase H type-1 domain-containing protein n=1 Tax=Trichogramma brassicae TaxID=86971 RepID=A0A6H5J0X1_9HYME|nr:unnamed protein product [Trichogramma brassicae]